MRRASKVEWEDANRERRLAQMRERYLANRDAALARQHELRSTPEAKAEQRDYNAAYYEQHADGIKAALKEKWAAMTPEQRLEEGRQRRAAQDPDERRASKRGDQARVKLEVIMGYGGECVCCRGDYLPHLTLDHVNGDGAERRKIENARSTYRRLRRLLRDGTRDEDFQILCWNCNMAKHHLGRCGCQDKEVV